jgi:two-component system cell cycle sensor histidine kinase/response regulator CckA
VKNIEATAVDLSSWLAAIVQSSDDAMLSTSLDGTILTWNAAAERLYGHRAAEIVGESISILCPVARADEIDDIHARLELAEHIDHFETQRVRKDGELLDVSLSISPVYDGDGNVIGAAAIAQDITTRRELELERRHAQKLEALGSLASGVAHDFNNLLTVILGCGAIALDPASPDDAREAVEEIVSAAGRAGDLAHQLLAFSREEPAVTCLVDLNGVVRDLTSLLARVVPKNIELEILLDPELAPVSGDPTQLEQIVMNLAVNARDAMPGGGRLTIATRRVDEESARTREGLEPGSYSALVVSDTGVGMSAETKARVFEPFFTTKPLGVGTGLGLATVRRIVEQSHGNVVISSEPGAGTVCTVYLPYAGLRAGRPGPGDPQVAAGESTILVVEDDDGLRRLATTVLRLNGYRVIGAPGGREAIEAVATHEGSIQLVLSDVVMPQMSGPELAQRLAELGLTMPTVFMSGHREDEIAEQGIVPTHGAVLDKPFTPDLLLERVRAALDRAAEHA